MPSFQQFSGNKQIKGFVYLLANLDMTKCKPIYPETNLGLEINQFSKVVRIIIFSSYQSHNNKPTYELEKFDPFDIKLSHLRKKNSEKFEVKLIYSCKAICCIAFT